MANPGLWTDYDDLHISERDFSLTCGLPFGPIATSTPLRGHRPGDRKLGNVEDNFERSPRLGLYANAHFSCAVEPNACYGNRRPVDKSLSYNTAPFIDDSRYFSAALAYDDYSPYDTTSQLDTDSCYFTAPFINDSLVIGPIHDAPS